MSNAKPGRAAAQTTSQMLASVRPAGADTSSTIGGARPYLSAEQLAALTPWTPDAIEKLVKRGVLVRGLHYFQPLGRRTKLIFKWEAVTALIEGRPVPSTGPAVVDGARAQRPRPVPARRTIDVEKATTDIQRMLS